MSYSFDDALEDVESLDTFDSMLFYGDGGRGKTNLAASAIHAGFNRVVIADIEGSAKGVGRLNPGVKRLRINSFNDLELFNAEVLANPNDIDLLIFDTLNAGNRLAINHFKSLPQNRSNKYGAWDDLLMFTNEWMRSIPTIFIAHAVDEKNESTGSVKTMPKVQGSASQDVPTIPDVVGYLQFENVGGTLKRVLYVGGSETLVTKNRFGLPDKIYDPTMSSIMDLIEEAKKSGNQEAA